VHTLQLEKLDNRRDMSDLSLPEARAKLKEQFIKFGGDKYGEGWADLVSVAISILPGNLQRPSLLSRF
jgi:hypothetical protein